MDLVKLLSLAAILAKLSKNETRCSLVALAWALRNREGFRNKMSNSPMPGISRLVCSGAIFKCGKSILVRPWHILAFLKPRSGHGVCKSLAIAFLVWSGEETDPTAGSTHFHRHDDWPEWAKSSEPVALIGNWFFYKEIDTQS